MKKTSICQVASETPTNGRSVETESSANSANEKLVSIGLPSVIIGRIAAILESGEPLVDFPGNASGKLVSARSLVPIAAAEIGREVALSFEDGDAAMPIIAGLLQTPKFAPHPQFEVKLDDEFLVLSAKKEIVIRCGKASITLTSAGKVLIQGEYVLSRSSGVNKIRGGSIQLN
jgi:Domain of unknown function (DUF6484)